MSNHVQVRWNSGMSREEFQQSREAIHKFPHLDAVTVTVGIKGELTEGDLDQILTIASRSEAEVKVTLTGTFEAGQQLRLFGPPDQVSDQSEMDMATVKDPDGPEQAEWTLPDGAEDGAKGEG